MFLISLKGCRVYIWVTWDYALNPALDHEAGSWGFSLFCATLLELTEVHMVVSMVEVMDYGLRY